MPWPRALLERDTALWGQRSKMQTGKNKTENGVATCKSATFLVTYSELHLFSSEAQAYIFLRDILRQWTILQVLSNSFIKTIPQKLQDSSTATTEFFHWYNADYESQAVKSEVQYTPYETWKDHSIMNACLTETWGSDSMRHTLGDVFQSAGLLALVMLMPSAVHALAFMTPPTH